MRQVGTIDGLARGAKLGPRIVGTRPVRPVAQSILHPSTAPALDGIIRQPHVTATPSPSASPVAKRRYWQIPLAIIMAAGLIGVGSWTLSLSTPKPAPVTPAVNAVPAPAAAPVITELNSLLERFAGSTGAATGIAVIDLATGQAYGANPDQVFVSASLYKLFIAEAIYTRLDDGSLKASHIVPGTGRSTAECLRLMITVSDNSCGTGLGNLVGWEKQNARWHAQGFTNTNLFHNKDEKTSAGDVALLLKRLHDGTLLSPTSTEAFTAHLKNQRINNRLPQGLPVGSTIAHKTGDLNGLVHDAGIVYGPNGNYVISMMTGPWKNPSLAPSKFAGLAKEVDALMRTAR